tara:strand:+ start:22247 stop:23320 length:1074 start_codon:yes stop_codon:yes gene_type:complete
MNKLPIALGVVLSVAGTVAAQNNAIFPPDYTAVPEGPFNSPNLPLARGTSRVQCLYDAIDVAIPSGNQITRLGFREDGTTTQLDLGRSLQLEIRMGWSNEDHQSMTTNFDNNYESPPVTVFGPALFVLPDLRDAAAPLTNGEFYIDLTAPFAYVPNGRNLVVEYRVFGTSGGGSPFTYRLDRADYVSTVTYGVAGCQHAGGGPPVISIPPTRPGLSFSTSVTAGPTNAPAFLVVGLGSGIVPPYSLAPIFNGISPLCQGQVNPTGFAILSGATSSSGADSWQFSIPNNNLWGNYLISSQALFLDFFSPGQVVASNAGHVLTGIRPRTTIVSTSGVPTVVTTGSKSTHYSPVALFEHQ